MRAPSTSANNSSTGGAPGGKISPKTLEFTTVSFDRWTTLFSYLGLYVSDIASVASVMGSFGSPFFRQRGDAFCQGTCAGRVCPCLRAAPAIGTAGGSGPPCREYC